MAGTVLQDVAREAAPGSDAAALLVAERFDRREANGPPGRIDGAEHAHAECEGKPPRKDAGREVRLQQGPAAA